MKCIVGLGNPGKKYNKTRHNVGFMVIDELAGRYGWKLKKDKFNGKSTVETCDGEKVILLKPQTFMNLSGESVRPLMDFYQIDPEDVLVRSEEHTSELQSRFDLVCRLVLEKK